MVASKLKGTTELQPRGRTGWVSSARRGGAGGGGEGENWGLTGTGKSLKISLKTEKQLLKKSPKQKTARQNDYRIYSNKRRIWDKKVNIISAALE